MNIRRVDEYWFYTTADLDNPRHDRRHRHGIEAKATIPSGTRIRVEVNGVFDDGGKQVGGLVRLYHVDGNIIRELDEALAAMDPGCDEKPRSLSDLAARNFSDGPWFAHAAMERLIADGTVTLDQVQAAWDAVGEAADAS